MKKPEPKPFFLSSNIMKNETPAQLPACKTWRIFKNTYFYIAPQGDWFSAFGSPPC